MALNYYRKDFWVKTTLGPAVSGAQIWVCTQPTNVTPPVTPPRTTPVPWQGPNPQALIYSDAGLTPIVQPLLTDGTGHADFYTLPGVYTVVIMYSGRVQEVLTDQSVGSVGSAGTAVIFETNGTPNFNQSLQNLTQGAGVTIATDNLGNTTISNSVIPPPPAVNLVLQTNETLNGSQTLLDLHAGSNITLTDNGVGRVTIASSGGGGGGSFSYPFWSTEFSMKEPQVGSFGLGGSNYQIYCTPLRLSCSTIITSATTKLFSGLGGGGVTFTIAIYSWDGNTKLWDSGVFDGGSTAVQTNTVTPVTIPAGVYRVALGASTSVLVFNWGVDIDTFSLYETNNALQLVLAGSSYLLGMPATLGILVDAPLQNIGWPGFLFQ